MRNRHRKRKALALARLFAGLNAEARKRRVWEPRTTYRVSTGLGR
jgi:hypothetical protein